MGTFVAHFNMFYYIPIMPRFASFPGEAFLAQVLPDYATRQEQLTLWIGLVVVGMILAVPLLYSWQSSPSSFGKEEKGNPKRKTSLQKTKGRQKTVVEQQQKETVVRFSIMEIASLALLVGGTMIVYMILTQSPHNIDVARSVFEIPLLTDAEVEQMRAMNDRVAHVNHQRAAAAAAAANSTATSYHMDASIRQEFLQHPVGWRKERQPEYPLTDLQIETDPYQAQDWNWMEGILDARLAPALQRIYGLKTPLSLRTPGMLMIRYEPGVRTQVQRHTDDQHISFIVGLNQDYQGGGTRYWNRVTQKPFGTLHPSRLGNVILFDGIINHEGLETTGGIRYIWIGFVSVDRRQYGTGRWTGLSWYNTWCNANWLARWLILTLEDLLAQSQKVKAKRYERLAQPNSFSYPTWMVQSKRLQEWIIATVDWLTLTVDRRAPHVIHPPLVTNEQAHAYLQAMDEAYWADEGLDDEDEDRDWSTKRRDRYNRATWFAFRGGLN